MVKVDYAGVSRDWRLPSFAVECWPLLKRATPKVVNHKTRSGRKFAVASTWGQSQKLNIQPRSRSPLVHLAGIRKKSFDGKTVIDNLNLTINNGEFHPAWPSGCGKTTVLRLYCRAGKRRQRTDPSRRSRYHFMFRRKTATSIPVFQSYALFPHMTVFENVAFGLRMQKTRRRKSPAGDGCLKMVQLEAFAQRKPHQPPAASSSAAIARAVVNKPRLLLLMSPFGAGLQAAQADAERLKALQRKPASPLSSSPTIGKRP